MGAASNKVAVLDTEHIGTLEVLPQTMEVPRRHARIIAVYDTELTVDRVGSIFVGVDDRGLEVTRTRKDGAKGPRFGEAAALGIRAVKETKNSVAPVAMPRWTRKKSPSVGPGPSADMRLSFLASLGESSGCQNAARFAQRSK